jgi:hypothetical protein
MLAPDLNSLSTIETARRIAAAHRAGEPLPDLVNAGSPVVQPLGRYDFVPASALLAMQAKRHAELGKAGDATDGDRSFGGHWGSLATTERASQSACVY